VFLKETGIELGGVKRGENLRVGRGVPRRKTGVGKSEI
jgi:hypothetical protein